MGAGGGQGGGGPGGCGGTQGGVTASLSRAAAGVLIAVGYLVAVRCRVCGHHPGTAHA